MIKLRLQEGYNQVKENQQLDLPDFTIITGLNGSGKSQFLYRIINGGDYSSAIFNENNGEYTHIHFQEEGLNPQTILNEAYIDDAATMGRYSAIANLMDGQRKLSGKQEININNLNDSYKKTIFDEHNANNNDYTRYIRFITDDDIKYVDAVIKKKGSNDLQSIDFLIFGTIITYGLFSTNLTALFKQFALKQRHYPKRADGQKAPWTLLEEILDATKLNYKVTQPTLSEDLTRYNATLTNSEGVKIRFNGLSSGEKTIMSLLFSLYNSEIEDIERRQFPEVLLLDEPDASLHPSLTKKFLDVLENTLVRKNNVKVIITTHSPSTVALAPEFALYEMVDGVLSKSNRKSAIKSLTTGLSNLTVLYEHQKQIFVEAKADATFYQELFDILQDYLDKEKILYFIPSGVQSEGGSTRVKELTDNLYSSGNKSVCGLLDYDGKNVETERIKVVGLNERYAIENYFLDPIILAYFLIYEGIESPTDVGLKHNINIRNFEFISVSELQTCVDVIIKRVKSNKVKGMLETDDLIDIVLLNGFVIKIPHWYLNSNGHKLEDSCKETFQKLKGYNANKPLIEAITSKSIRNIYQFLSKSILVAFKKLQDLPID